ncbi:uncharacterized protein J7T54_004971 [Emericellopsis cladophorae]|uniref:RING-type domain-containing protein n=1 Tax=Emericellopsis cladophorae TaxID=2686198 RepID=A0A9Q0BEN5_9HYPO|nr:uncharacterized protein J7T54_004971 [Emericellopsis cladophorae]KAI6781805.1 hypothetical protein J7T54_004971 [Emericellopsis cladophorae]
MCIFVERKYVCYDPEAVEAATHSNSRPAPIADPLKPWRSYQHGQVVNAADQMVWHVLKSRVRCACLNARMCTHAPREVRTEVYANRSCPDCTGSDRCVSRQPPTLVAVDGHDNLDYNQRVWLACVAEALLARAIVHETAVHGSDEYKEKLWIRDTEGRRVLKDGRRQPQFVLQDYRNNLQAEIDHGEDVAQDWYADNPVCSIREEDWLCLLQTKLFSLQDSQRLQSAIWTKRFRYGHFVVKTVANDPGMSSGIAAMLRQMLPCLLDSDYLVEGQTYGNNGGVYIHRVLKGFVEMLDAIPDTLTTILSQRMPNRMTLWEDCLENRRRRVREVVEREIAFDDFLGRPRFAVEGAVVQQENIACPICGGPWSRQWPLMRLPCCQQAAHVVCVKKHFQHQDKKKGPTCPFCRQDMVDHGWTPIHLRLTFATTFSDDAGLVPLRVFVPPDDEEDQDDDEDMDMDLGMGDDTDDDDDDEL